MDGITAVARTYGLRKAMKRLQELVLTAATMAVLIAVGVVVLVTPVTHVLLKHSSGGDALALTSAQANAVSDATIHEILWHGHFNVVTWPDGQPFYNAGEISHLMNVRSLFWTTMMLGVVSLSAIALVFWCLRRRAGHWRAIQLGAGLSALIVVVVGAVSSVWFDQAFTIFHEVLFPQGNFTFDPATDVIVSLYPDKFWQLMGGTLGVTILTLALLTWWFAHRKASRLPRN